MNTAGRHRAPVLPDLRAGGGFSFVCWIDMAKIPVGFEGRKIIVNGMSSVSGSLDEEDAEDITKGFKIEAVDNTIVLFLTDGFKTEFEFTVFEVDQCDQPQIEEFYEIKRSTNNKTANRSQTAMLAFNLDGGPKVASCVINNHLYNLAPSGWKFLPREFGEIGGNHVEVQGDLVEEFQVFDRALSTSECISLYRRNC